MIRLNIHEIKVQLSKYIEMVEAGETIVVCKRNIPVAEIRSIAAPNKKIPTLGSAAGKSAGKSVKEPLPPEDLRLWEGGDKNDPLRKYKPTSKDRRR
jgi:antitoxin (DNA-binding transcriptional repressor) of toxin-antitoxin stability system